MKNNRTIRTIIVDDEIHWQTIIKKLVATIPELSLEGIFSDAESAYDFLMERDIDLIILDIQIQDDNGIDLIKRLHKSQNVIIISSSSAFAFEGFNISAVDYLKKPLDFDSFSKAVNKVIRQIQLQHIETQTPQKPTFDTNYFLIKEEQTTLKIHYNDVLYISALENYIKIITSEKTYIVLTTLAQFERSLTNHPFLRVHRSYFVNLNYVKTLTKNSCILTNAQEIPIGNLYKTDIDKVFVQDKLIKR